VDLKDKALAAARAGEVAVMRQLWILAAGSYGLYRDLVDGRPTRDLKSPQPLTDRQSIALETLVDRLTKDPMSEAAPEISRFVRSFA
jgi:hypothetical protein